MASDLDGTLLRSDGTVSEGTATALARLDELGIAFVMVTGRPRRWIEDLLRYVGPHGLAIVSNGALVWDAGTREPFLTRLLDAEAGRRICADLRAAAPGTSFAVEGLGGIGLEPEFLERSPKPDDSRRAHVDDLLDGPSLKILARHESLEPEHFWATAREVVGARATPTISTTRTALVEISAPGVTKASTLALVCEHLGVEAADVVAFGDMPNDLPMLEWAGTSYAMADAHPALVAAADHVAPGHDDDGVARVLAELVDGVFVEGSDDLL